jgi:hypothetical protein
MASPSSLSNQEKVVNETKVRRCERKFFKIRIEIKGKLMKPKAGSLRISIKLITLQQD